VLRAVLRAVLRVTGCVTPYYGVLRRGIPGEVLQKVIQHLKASYPTNMVTAAMSSIKERHNGRFPI
jgi:hypothetical protein